MEIERLRIENFLKKHHVMTLATCQGAQPWCAQCFYVFLEDEMILAFTSDADTRHIREVMAQPLVAASVVLETRIVGKIQGIQLEGIVTEPDEDLKKSIEKAYCKRFPIAAVMDTRFWCLQISSAKMTDNLLGFGKKLYWVREER